MHVIQLCSCARQDTDKYVQQNNAMVTQSLDTATLGAGCFWCVEAVFEQLKGVQSVVSGFAGGHVRNPSYREVCTGETGHAEVCQVVYDPSIISFRELLKVYWEIHDPTTLNRQGGDVGTQYRSVIYFHSKDQENQALELKNKLNAAGIWENPVITEIAPFTEFYKAEDYHQEYYVQNMSQPYCNVVITPKVEKFRKLFADKLKKTM
jgi:peptide-methionine (S)-S-oxide reductase